MSKSMTTYYKTNSTMWHSRWYSSDIWNTAKPHQNLAKTPPKPHQNIAFPAQNLTKTSHKTSKTSQKPHQNVAFLYSVPKGHQNLTKTSPKPRQNINGTPQIHDVNLTRHHQNTTQTSPKPHKSVSMSSNLYRSICQNTAQNMLKTQPEYVLVYQNTSKTLPGNETNSKFRTEQTKKTTVNIRAIQKISPK